MKPTSPLRYPGGKGSLSEYLIDLLEVNDLIGCHYFEPYAGGAGAALNLLVSNCVSEISINDADPRIFAIWHSILNHNDKFIEQLHGIPLNIEEWHKQQEICFKGDVRNCFELGFAAFYMNRCNRSGVLKGAGPIGGYMQDGKWRLDVRFNRAELISRIKTIGELKDRIHITGLDAITFLKSQLPRGRKRLESFVYADPPYVVKGQKLYLNSYMKNDHISLAKYLNKQSKIKWLVSYDNCSLIHEIYKTNQITNLPIRYSLQTKRAENELLIAPKSLYLPCINKKARIAT